MERHFGQPVKNVAVVIAEARHRGEFVVSRRGLEGSGIYNADAITLGTGVTLDLLPDLDVGIVTARLDRARGKETLANHLRKALRLDPVRLALLQEFARPLPEGAALAVLLKALTVRHLGPRPLDEAISTAGGVRWEAVTDDLMLTAMPGTFVAGEMLDWDAPTGGYLITGCLATGRRAGRSAALWAQRAAAR
jgi:predicted flavoprotein YhiN